MAQTKISSNRSKNICDESKIEVNKSGNYRATCNFIALNFAWFWNFELKNSNRRRIEN